MPDFVASLTLMLELGMAFAGLVLLWRHVLSPRARLQRRPPALAAWDVPITQFLLFLLSVFLVTTVAASTAGFLLKHLSLGRDAVAVYNGAAAQLGMLLGVVAYHFGVERFAPASAMRRTDVFRSGIATFLISLPILAAASVAWQAFLKYFGLPAEQQDLIRMFAHADSPSLLTVMIVLAVVIAPFAEELIFRAGMFRYFRTRMPRGVALVAPALFFATLHVGNWETLEGFASLAPLTVLAVVFSVAYERTGHIGTTIVAHGLFNLNTIVLIFAGIGV